MSGNQQRNQGNNRRGQGRGRGQGGGNSGSSSGTRSEFSVSLGSSSSSSSTATVSSNTRYLLGLQRQTEQRAGFRGSTNSARSNWSSTSTASSSSGRGLITSNPQRTTAQNVEAAQVALRARGRGQVGSIPGTTQSRGNSNRGRGTAPTPTQGRGRGTQGPSCVLEPEFSLYQQLLSGLTEQKEKQEFQVQIEFPPKK